MCLGKLLWRLDESLVTVLILQPCGYWGLWGQELAETLSHCYCLSHSLGSWQTGVVEELILITVLCF